jgi:hypothetical protein
MVLRVVLQAQDLFPRAMVKTSVFPITALLAAALASEVVISIASQALRGLILQHGVPTRLFAAKIRLLAPLLTTPRFTTALASTPTPCSLRHSVPLERTAVETTLPSVLTALASNKPLTSLLLRVRPALSRFKLIAVFLLSSPTIPLASTSRQSIMMRMILPPPQLAFKLNKCLLAMLQSLPLAQVLKMELCPLDKETKPVAQWDLQGRAECKDPQDRADKVVSRVLQEQSSA